jgi:hypothetical protein
MGRPRAEMAYWMKRFNADPEVLRSGATRQRCRKCRGYLWITGKKVHAIDGRFCSTTCAGWSAEALSFIDAWFDLRDNHCGCFGSTGRKIAYPSEQAAIEAIRPPRLMSVYLCPRNPTQHHLTGGAPKES